MLNPVTNCGSSRPIPLTKKFCERMIFLIKTPHTIVLQVKNRHSSKKRTEN